LTWTATRFTFASGKNNPNACEEIPVKSVKRGTPWKRAFSLLSIALFLTVAQGHAMSVFAEDNGNPKGAVPPVQTVPPETTAAGKAGGEAGKTVAKGVSTGTIGKGVALAAGILAIAIAASGGEGSTTTPAHH
jgi:hypothetical protein